MFVMNSLSFDFDEFLIFLIKTKMIFLAEIQVKESRCSVSFVLISRWWDSGIESDVLTILLQILFSNVTSMQTTNLTESPPTLSLPLSSPSFSQPSLPRLNPQLSFFNTENLIQESLVSSSEQHCIGMITEPFPTTNSNPNTNSLAINYPMDQQNLPSLHPNPGCQGCPSCPSQFNSFLHPVRCLCLDRRMRWDKIFNFMTFIFVI